MRAVRSVRHGVAVAAIALGALAPVATAFPVADGAHPTDRDCRSLQTRSSLRFHGVRLLMALRVDLCPRPDGSQGVTVNQSLRTRDGKAHPAGAPVTLGELNVDAYGRQIAAEVFEPEIYGIPATTQHWGALRQEVLRTSLDPADTARVTGYFMWHGPHGITYLSSLTVIVAPPHYIVGQARGVTIAV